MPSQAEKENCLGEVLGTGSHSSWCIAILFSIYNCDWLKLHAGMHLEKNEHVHSF